jgi:hypothetical protein
MNQETAPAAPSHYSGHTGVPIRDEPYRDEP